MDIIKAIILEIGLQSYVTNPRVKEYGICMYMKEVYLQGNSHSVGIKEHVKKLAFLASTPPPALAVNIHNDFIKNYMYKYICF